jgi:hypothetical protein
MDSHPQPKTDDKAESGVSPLFVFRVITFREKHKKRCSQKYCAKEYLHRRMNVRGGGRKKSDSGFGRDVMSPTNN